MVSSDIYRNVMDVYLGIRDKDSVESEKDRNVLAICTIFGEAAAAYCALSMVDGIAEEHLWKFVDKYWNVDKRHEYRARLLSYKVDEKYEKFKKFAIEFEKVRKKLKENDSEALNHLKTLFFNLLNELTYI